MSNIYILEPPTSGKVLLKTTVGDIDVELWAKETPKTCRNFIQLCLEGYYNDTIFHRVVRDFIVQGGDPRGDGTGGESIYDQPFKDEFHQRLRFARRGLLAMANAGKDDNCSQFFFTLAATPELQNKHTIFGKVTGETLFNMLKLGEGLIEDEKPEYPHKIISCQVLNNPFTDIIPRIREAKSVDKKKKIKELGVKNFKLLSFGEEAEEDEAETIIESKKYSGKSKSTHDILDDPKLSSVSTDVVENVEPEPEINPEERLENIRKKLQGSNRRKLPRTLSARATERKKDDDSEDDDPLKNIRKKLKVNHNKEVVTTLYWSSDEEEEMKKKKEGIQLEIKNVKLEYQKNKLKKAENVSQEQKVQEEKDKTLEEHKQDILKYKDKSKDFPKKGAAREQHTLKLFAMFRQKKQQAKEEEENKNAEVLNQDMAKDDDSSLFNHELHCESEDPILAKDANTKGDDWFEIYDPRNPLNKRRRGESTAK